MVGKIGEHLAQHQGHKPRVIPLLPQGCEEKGWGSMVMNGPTTNTPTWTTTLLVALALVALAVAIALLGAEPSTGDALQWHSTNGTLETQGQPVLP